jgi:hypothetical protein
MGAHANLPPACLQETIAVAKDAARAGVTVEIETTQKTAQGQGFARAAGGKAAAATAAAEVETTTSKNGKNMATTQTGAAATVTGRR